MNKKLTLLLAPLFMLITACSSHHSVSSHARFDNHVSVGVHGHARTSGVVGALIIGGVIGHLLTEEANNRDPNPVISQKVSSQDELVNGYPISEQQSIQAEKNDEQNKYYKLGKDGNCYLMEQIEGGESSVISQVAIFSCQ